MITDGDEWDTLAAYDSGSTLLASGAYALVLDAEYDGDYTLDASTTRSTCSSPTPSR